MTVDLIHMMMMMIKMMMEIMIMMVIIIIIHIFDYSEFTRLPHKAHRDNNKILDTFLFTYKYSRH